MSKKLINVSKRKLPYPHKEEAEFLKSAKGRPVCRICSAVFYKKSWHHTSAEAKAVGRVVCPACNMIKNKQYEGRVVVTDISSASIRNAVRNLIKSYSEKACRKDNQDRLIEVRENGNRIEATTTENQLAVRLGKKIKETFKGSVLKISRSSAPSDVVLVNISLPNPVLRQARSH